MNQSKPPRATLILTGTSPFKSDEFMQSLFAKTTDLIYRIRLGNTPVFEYINPAVSVLLGYTPDELYAAEDALFQLTQVEDHAELEHLLKFTSKPSYILRWLHQNGTCLWLDHHCIRVYNDNGDAVAVEGIARDITHGKVAAELLQRPNMEMAYQLGMIEQISGVLSGTLSSNELFKSLGQAVLRFFQDVNTIYISRFEQKRQEITCVYALQDGEILDHTLFPAVPLLPLGKGLQSEAIHKKASIIVDDLLEKMPDKVTYVGSLGPVARSAAYIPMISQGQVLGVLQLQSVSVGRFTNTDLRLLNWLAEAGTAALQNAMLFENLTKSRLELEQAYHATLESWAHALDLRDRETTGHTRRVASMAAELGRFMGIPTEEVKILEQGALLHDIGKMGIPDQILLKPGKLDEAEWQEMRRHPQYAYEMLKQIPHLQPVLDVPYCHHEKWDGSGYPRGLKGEEIPLSARIFSIVDVWDALCSDRPYRRAWETSKALSYIQEQNGLHFDPSVVSAFLEVIEVHRESFLDPYV